ncbi:MAG: hypothetical protein FWB98_04960 [Defluviitaleaceae bacterium]|nr:hypothetical protein [Defluviitaleaceae bacterium]
MKRYGVLLFIFGTILALASCGYRHEIPSADIGADGHSSLQPQEQPILISIGDIGGLQASQTFSNEFGVAFMVRNQTGQRLYYNDDFRVDGMSMSERNNPAGLQYINNGDIKESHVSWGTSRPTGIYTFERDFFLDAELTQLYKTLQFQFDVIAWYHFTADAQPIPDEIQAFRNQREQNSIAFQLSCGTSQIILLASEVSVSRTEIAFDTVNISSAYFLRGSYFSLWQVVDGAWVDVPPIIENWGFTLEGHPVMPGEIDRNRVNFEWLYGALANGDYVFKRTHSQDHLRPGAPRVQELLFIEFTIDDYTPHDLVMLEPVSVNIGISTDEVTPTGLYFSVINDSPNDLTFNSPFILQRYIYGSWEVIYEIIAPTRQQVSISSSEIISAYADWGEHLGKLPSGRYRMTAHFGFSIGGQVITHEFVITEEAFEAYTGNMQLNPMFEQHVIITDVTVTPTTMIIR